MSIIAGVLSIVCLLVVCSLFRRGENRQYLADAYAREQDAAQ